MRTIVTRSAQKKLAAEPPATKKPISKQTKASPHKKMLAKKSVTAKAASAGTQSPAIAKSSVKSSLAKRDANQLKLTPKKPSTSKLRS